MEGVSVMTNKSGGTLTDVHGSYMISVAPDDSIYFSYLGKPTIKFAVKTLVTANNFDISLQVESNMLQEVFVRPRSYKEDSMQNRLDYAKVFNYRKPHIAITSTDPYSGQGGVGFDLDELIDMFNVRKKKNTLAFQRRLVAG